MEDWGDEHRTHRAYETQPVPARMWLIAAVVALVGAVLLLWDW
jgi:hypothetical protein